MGTKSSAKAKAVAKVELPKLSNRAVLVGLNLSAWTARKLHKKETEDVVFRNNAANDAARVNCNLLPGCAELAAVHTAAGNIRTFVRQRTLPWNEGVGILLAAGYLDFQSKLSPLLGAFDRAVEDFIKAYPRLVQEAQASLKGLFDASNYPTQDELRGKFKHSVRFMPVPDEDDFRVDLGDEHIDMIATNIREHVEESTREANRVLYERIFEFVSKAHAAFTVPKGKKPPIFRDTMVSNIIDLCDVVPTLNLTGDQRLEKLCQLLRASLSEVTPKTIRKDANVRQKAASDMAKIMAKMGPWMGAAA